MLTKTVFSLLVGFVSLCVSQNLRPQLSFHNELHALTPPAAFQNRSNFITPLPLSIDDHSRNVALSAQQFGLDMLHRISSAMERLNKDFMVSPFSVWSLLLLLYEGAGGQTYNQLRQALRINVDDQTLRSVYRKWSSYLHYNTATIEVASLQALFTDQTSPLLPTYRDIMKNYNVDPMIVNFYEASTIALINEANNRSTRGLIPYSVLPQDVFGAKLFMLSSLFFKGQWKYPFLEIATHPEPFYPEKGNITTVSMMMQESNLAYAVNIEGLDGYVLELPYGQLDRLSMFIVLPKMGFKLTDISKNLKKIGIAPIVDAIAKFKLNAPEDNAVEVVMPKFITTTDFYLNNLLIQMGVKDIFNETADLSRMGSGLFAKLVVHSSKIIVDELGTRAAATASAVLINKSTPPKFHLNRPFQYMIVEKTTGLLLFAGQVRNPEGI